MRIQKTLHSLHGGGAIDVADVRSGLTNMVKDKSLSNAERGLAIHALGDAYAHTATTKDGDVAYAPGMGHGHRLSRPDFVSNNKEKYGAYLGNLTQALGALNGKTPDVAKINEITKMTDGLSHADNNGDAEIDEFRALAQGKSFGYDKSYEPEKSANEIDPSLGSLNKEKVSSTMDKMEASVKKEKGGK